jgi:sugar (pentulose or hexulose) kinase
MGGAAVLRAGEGTNYLAFDCSNSSVRVVVGNYDGSSVNLDVVHRVDNAPVEVAGLYYWDIIRIYSELKKGIGKAFDRCGSIHSAGICTWGVDFGLIDGCGHLIGNPLSYRNPMAQAIIDEMPDDELHENYYATGIQNDRINTLYQILAARRLMPERLAMGRKVLLIPDLILYMLTGAMKSEPTIMSTTEMMDVRSGTLSQGVLQRYGFSDDIMAPMARHGEVVGTLRSELREELGVPHLPIVCVASHDTASAVAGTPIMSDDCAFISSGTWSLIGVELNEPVINQSAMDRGFTNEAGLLGTITFLKNSCGLFAVQRIKQELESQGTSLDWDSIVQMAEAYNGPLALMDLNDPRFFNPSSMIRTMQDYFRATGQAYEDTPPALFRSAYESLALSYRFALQQTSDLVPRDVRTIHVVGGGSKNKFLNQLTANAVGVPVLAGPAEATCMGNICTQIASHMGSCTLRNVRSISHASVEGRTYEPSSDALLDQKVDSFARLLTQRQA